MTLGSQCSRATLLLLIVAMVAVTSSSADAANTVLKFDTDVGNLYVRLLDNTAPGTVQNFLTYVNNGDYNDSFFHRLAYDFVLQGGGFRSYGTEGLGALPSYGPNDNEFGRYNVRGTLAMAKLGGDPNSATNGFFFNLNDNNAGNLDFQNGGFTVFAYVIGDGMGVVDRLAAYPPNPEEVYIVDWTESWGSAFDTLPVLTELDGDGVRVVKDLEWINAVSVVGVDGDVDFDGEVDIDDYNGFLASFGEVGIGLAADFDGDYDVDLDDFAVLRANYGASAPSPPLAPGAATPEPGSICLLGLCGIAMIRKRRGKS